MDLAELEVFIAVATERSFSRAAEKLHRTQPAVSQTIKRLEKELNERLFDRSSKAGRLTEAGELLLNYALRLTQLKTEAESAVKELQDLRHGRVVIGANEAAIHVLLPVIMQFRQEYPQTQVEVRRISSRHMSAEVLNRTLDFGVLTFAPRERGLHTVRLGEDELVMLMPPTHPLSKREKISMDKFGSQTVIAHNEASPARERVLSLYEQRHESINIQIGLPSLDGIKRAVEMGLGVAILPRRCALTEISKGQLTAVPVAQLQLRREIKLVSRQSGRMSHAAEAFLKTALAFAESTASAIANPQPSSQRHDSFTIL